MFYLLYRLGHLICISIPVNASYAIAAAVAWIYYHLAWRDRNAVIRNLRIVLHGADEKTIKRLSKGVFKNFAKYLVEFFRFSALDADFVKSRVKVEGLDNLEKGRARGKGTIILSAHIGNWEFGGFIVPLLGYPLSAVVLSHQDKKINDFFTRQRRIANMTPIEIGVSLRSCFEVLRNNGFLALLGDRDFSGRGMMMDFFGKKAIIPKGPAALSQRLNATIVPCFMIREKDDSFKLVFEDPIFPDLDEAEDVAIPALTERCLAVIESYIRRYPDQWYIFKDFWDPEGNKPSSNKII